MNLLEVSLTSALNMLFKETTHVTWLLKILSWNYMTVDSKIFSKKSMTLIISNNSKKRNFGTSIDSLMIWLLTQSNLMEVSCGPARTMMEMFNLISLLKVTDLLVSWLQSLDAHVEPLKLKPLMVPLLDIIDSINKVKKPQLTQLLLCLHGPKVLDTEDNSITIKHSLTFPILSKKLLLIPLRRDIWLKIWLSSLRDPCKLIDLNTWILSSSLIR